MHLFKSVFATLIVELFTLQRLGSTLSDDAPWRDGLKVSHQVDGLICQLESTDYVLAVNLNTAEILVEIPDERPIKTEIAFPDDSPTDGDEERCIDAINNLEGDIEDSDTIQTVVQTTYAGLTTTDLQ
ncbi:hypothetical protein Pmar_PMAR019993 [Perkinsus marinus ATCC 50983]|uniref:Uncharacterized protein n=1 Tax=Perkinsus marinus (strain ATCC 50983 / TXsc) TaxID=423536 RepID=C5LJ99_PERM5|nr:hypothetical protein Pmar_PMAR028308 [Perkinsus marinus ATCC 50983]XP_002771399.1 hypothetical protein Pmar_PMAR019993 [Perkinsus marinus ATCC 50983]EER01856.1 hypothetical protein Pmar_PMAR028308 [Perkinsus marinus ATCC 50983]EER03215.1 hypothetical protein Pmar_PMAR019993 [Perkinsus marinus ATCC 50983]|eukprot:XP_002769138.1 hypothetical protein Pmar_PMAR028308 [Perkinsus marinus ATCC 50983]